MRKKKKQKPKNPKHLTRLFDRMKAYYESPYPQIKSHFKKKNKSIYTIIYNVKPRKGSIGGHLEKRSPANIACGYLLGTFIFILNNNKECNFIIYFLI